VPRRLAAQARGSIRKGTREANQYSADLIRAPLGKLRLRHLTARHVQAALNGMTAEYSSRTILLVHNALSRSIRHARPHDHVARNFSELADTPRGKIGGPSKSFTVEQTRALLAAAQKFPTMNAYIVVSLLTGAFGQRRSVRCDGATSTWLTVSST
jgi:hypothetical protein